MCQQLRNSHQTNVTMWGESRREERKRDRQRLGELKIKKVVVPRHLLGSSSVIDALGKGKREWAEGDSSLGILMHFRHVLKMKSGYLNIWTLPCGLKNACGMFQEKQLTLGEAVSVPVVVTFTTGKS